MADVRRLAPEGDARARDASASRHDPLGRHALFSERPDEEQGPLVMDCSACGERSRLTIPAALRAHAPLFLWIPIMQNSRWMLCPRCEQRAWARLRLRR